MVHRFGLQVSCKVGWQAASSGFSFCGFLQHSAAAGWCLCTLICCIMSHMVQTHKLEEEGRPRTSTTTSNQENTDIQQQLTGTVDQATLTGPTRPNREPWDDLEGNNGISIHGPCCHGPRTFLTITRSIQ